MGNRERILEASLELFNEHGSGSVTTNHIAAHLSISPGNLYYHFRNKEEIIRTLYPRFGDAVRGALALPDDREITAQDVGRYHVAGIEALWEFRFLLRDSKELLERDPVLVEPFHELQQGMIQQLLTLFERLIAQGQMRRPDPPDDLLRVARSPDFLL